MGKDIGGDIWFTADKANDFYAFIPDDAKTESGEYSPVADVESHKFEFAKTHDKEPMLFFVYTDPDNFPESDTTHDHLISFNAYNLVPPLSWEGNYAGRIQYNKGKYSNGAINVTTAGTNLSSAQIIGVFEKDGYLFNLTSVYLCAGCVYKWVAVWA